MNVVFALVGVSVVLVIGIAIALLWAIRSGQFEDMEGPAWRVVMDDDRPSPRSDANSDTGSKAAESPHDGRDATNKPLLASTSACVEAESAAGRDKGKLDAPCERDATEDEGHATKHAGTPADAPAGRQE
jgi:cbb3-type cytochrome oxidase maturation protein